MKYSNRQSVPVGAPLVNPAPLWFSGAPDPPPDAIRELGLWFALGVVFLRYSGLHEALTYYGGSNAYILYIFAVPALFCLVGSGGIQRVFSARPNFYWLGFIIWLFITVPFSTWKGESAQYAWNYVRTDLPMLVLLAGLPISWKECRKVIYTISIAGLASVLLFKVFDNSSFWGGRVGLSFGTMSNPNDYAGQLILLVPFVLFMVLRPMKVAFPLQKLLQVAGVVAVASGSYLILGSASRGALLGILSIILFSFFKSGGAVRVGLLVTVPLAWIVLLALLPQATVERLQSFTTSTAIKNDEATESADLRRRLLQASVVDTLTHPVFGVGPGQFPNYEGKTKTHSQGGFINSHNSYTEISSETGLPGIFFYLAGTISAFLLLQRTWKIAAPYPQLKDVTTACFCISIAYVGFCVAIFFLNFAYFFHLPGFSGLVVTLSMAVKRETDALTAVQQPVQPAAPMVFTARRPTPAWATNPIRPAAAPQPSPFRRNG